MGRGGYVYLDFGFWNSATDKDGILKEYVEVCRDNKFSGPEPVWMRNIKIWLGCAARLSHGLCTEVRV